MEVKLHFVSEVKFSMVVIKLVTVWQQQSILRILGVPKTGAKTVVSVDCGEVFVFMAALLGHTYVCPGAWKKSNKFKAPGEVV